MKNKVNKGKNRLIAVAFTFIFGFLCLGLILPDGYCSADNPYCSGDQDKIQELVEDFKEKYGEDVKISWNENTAVPYIVGGMEIGSSTKTPKETALSFLSENASFFGLDIDDLEFNDIQENAYMKYVDFDQFYKGVHVYSGDIRVFLRLTDGAVSSVSSRYFPCIDLDVVPKITAEEAAAVVKADLGAWSLVNVETSFSEYGIAQKQVSPIVPELIIYPKDNGKEMYLCWSFMFHIEMPYGPYGSWYYYIDAKTGNIVSHGSLMISGESGNGNTTNNTSSIYNNYYNNYYNRQANSFNWLSGPVYNQTPYYVSPYNNTFNNTFFPVYNTPYSHSFFNPVFNNNPVFNTNNFFPQFDLPFSSSFSNPMLNFESPYYNFSPLPSIYDWSQPYTDSYISWYQPYTSWSQPYNSWYQPYPTSPPPVGYTPVPITHSSYVPDGPWDYYYPWNPNDPSFSIWPPSIYNPTNYPYSYY
ncbi:PepSY domain-containing protein [bacterium]|nr:PepSY domain-containing protein [bacterium]